MAVYRLSGHLLASEIGLESHAPALQGREPPADIVLRRSGEAPQAPLAEGSETHSIDIDGQPFLTVAKLGGGRLFRAHGAADFRIDAAGHDVDCTPVPGCPDDVLAQLVVDRVLPHVLDLRGVPVLHASAVAIGQIGAVAFVGDPGSGKSTMAGALSPPHALLCDDCAALRLEADRVLVLPSYSFVRLREDAATRLGLSTEQLARSPQHTYKWRLHRPSSAEEQPLVRLYALRRGAGAPAVGRLGHRDALAELARHLYRMDPTDRAKLGRELELLERLTAAVPVATLTVPDDLGTLGAAVEAVLTDASRPAQ